MGAWPEHAGQPGRHERPDQDHENCTNATSGTPVGESARSFGAMLGKDRGRNQPNGECQAEGNQEEIVDVAEDGNEIGNEVDRAERVGNGESGECLGMPWNP